MQLRSATEECNGGGQAPGLIPWTSLGKTRQLAVGRVAFVAVFPQGRTSELRRTRARGRTTQAQRESLLNTAAPWETRVAHHQRNSKSGVLATPCLPGSSMWRPAQGADPPSTWAWAFFP